MLFRNFFKNYFFGICFIASAFNIAAQTNDDPPQKKIADPKDHIVFDLNYDGYTHLPDGIKQKPFSIGTSVYLMWDYPLGYGPFSFAIGAGISVHNVHNNGQIAYSPDGRYTQFVPITSSYKINKFSCNYFEVPMELRIRKRGEKSVKLSIGGKIGYAFNVHTKFEDDNTKVKVYKIKNINPLRYGVTLRLGYNKYNIQAFYALSELFKKDHGEPKMVPFSIGVGLLLY